MAPSVIQELMMLTSIWKRMCVVLLVVGALSASACDLILLVLTVSNDSPVDVCELYVSSSASSSWGSNELYSGAVLSTGETFDILMVSGTYDLKFVDCMGTEGTIMGVDLYDDTSVSYQY